MNKEQAQVIYDMLELDYLLQDDEEMHMLEKQNPELLDAYFALHRFIFGADSTEIVNDSGSAGKL